MIDLKPCPFCGGEALVYANDGVRVICKKCHCQTFPRVDGCISDCERFNSLDSVIEAWNRRPEPPRGFDLLYHTR